MAFDFQSTDATTNWNVEEGLLSKDEAFLFESADGCISAEAFDAVFAELIWFVEVTGSNASNVKALRETVGVEDTWTFTARDWTQHDNPPKGQIVEKGTRTDEKLRWLAERKCAFWGLVRPSSRSMSVVLEYTKPRGLVRPLSRSISVVLEYTKPRLLRTSVLEEQRNPLELRLIGVGICHWFLELSEAAVGLLISSSIPGWSAKYTRCSLWLESTALLICEWLFGSKAFKYIRLVGSRIGSRLGSFVGSLIGCCNWVKWFI